MEKAFASIQEIAKWLGTSETTVNRMVHSGELPGFWIQRTIRIPIKAVHEYLDAHQVIPDHDESFVLQRNLKAVPR